MKKKLLLISFALVLLLALTLIPALPASAAEVYLEATAGGPGTGTEDRVVVTMPAGTTLDDLDSIAWQEYLVKGYPPHVDIYLDFEGDPLADDCLVVEYAYNTATHYGEAHTATEAYGAVTGVWKNTFNDDGNGPNAVTDTTYAWLNSGAAGPYPVSVGLPIAYASVGSNFVGGTLADWKAGNIVNKIDGSAEVVRLEIEIDNWIRDTQAYVRNIQVDLGASSSVGLEVVVPDIVAISVTPTAIDFGNMLPGTTSSPVDIDVENVGTHAVDVDASVTGSAMIMANLWLKNYTIGAPDWAKGTPWATIISNLAMGATETCRTKLEIPSDHTPAGAEAATLVFEATAL